MKNAFSIVVVILVMFGIALTATFTLLQIVKIVDGYQRLQQQIDFSAAVDPT